MPTPRRYWIETQDAILRLYKANGWNRLTGKVPKVVDGTITIDKKVYVIDPSKYRRTRIKKFPFRHEWAEVQIWKENDPEAIPHFGAKPREDDMTGDTMGVLSRSMRLKRLIQPDFDWKTVIMAGLIGLFAGALMAFVYTTGGK